MIQGSPLIVFVNEHRKRSVSGITVVSDFIFVLHPRHFLYEFVFLDFLIDTRTKDFPFGFNF